MSAPFARPTARRAAASAAAAALLLSMVTACTPDAVEPEPETPSASADPGTPSEGASEDPSPSDPEPAVDPGEERRANLVDAVSSGNTAAIDGYLAERVRVVIAASEADMQQSAVDAVLSLDYVQPGVGVWDFEIDPELVAVYAGSPYYGQFFPADAIVGRSSAGPLVSFVPDGDTIGTIFMSIDENLVAEY